MFFAFFLRKGKFSPKRGRVVAQTEAGPRPVRQGQNSDVSIPKYDVFPKFPNDCFWFLIMHFSQALQSNTGVSFQVPGPSVLPRGALESALLSYVSKRLAMQRNGVLQSLSALV